MRDEPFYALISGFDPVDVPGVGTFYGFQDRLLDRPRRPAPSCSVPTIGESSKIKPTPTGTKKICVLTKI
jgi:hypothetical protein